LGSTSNYRLEQAQPILIKLKKWLDETRPSVAPKTALGKAIYYLDHQWPRLIRYLDNGHYPIDNNPVENAIRPFAIGRKAWMFSTSVQGAKASANLYSLIETAKANGLEPYAYLKTVFSKLPNITSYDDVDKLLPINCK
jgi:transposase